MSASCTSSCSAYAPGAWTESPTVSTPCGPRMSGSATTGVPVGTDFFGARPVLGDLAAELVAEHQRLVGPAEAVVAHLLGERRPTRRSRGARGGRSRRSRSA